MSKPLPVFICEPVSYSAEGAIQVVAFWCPFCRRDHRHRIRTDGKKLLHRRFPPYGGECGEVMPEGYLVTTHYAAAKYGENYARAKGWKPLTREDQTGTHR